MVVFAPAIRDLTLNTTGIETFDSCAVFINKKVQKLYVDDLKSYSKITQTTPTIATLTDRNIYVFSKYPISFAKNKKKISYSASIENAGDVTTVLYHGFELKDKNGKTLDYKFYPINSKVSCAEIIQTKINSKKVIIKGEIAL